MEQQLKLNVAGEGVVFTDRLAGASTGAFSGLNLSHDVGDEASAVTANRTAVSSALGISDAWVTVRQVHGTGVHVAGSTPVDRSVEADAIIGSGDAPIAVMVADCAPVALAGRKGYAVVHGGWRSLAAGIMDDVCGTISATRAWVGPCIHPCHYQVGPEVAQAFEARYPRIGSTHYRDGRFDLPSMVMAILHARGVRIDFASQDCTSCSSHLFSHRRDGVTGRQAVLMFT